MREECLGGNAAAPPDRPMQGVVLWSDAADFDHPKEIFPGVWWIRLPHDGNVSHVNVYAFEEGTEWSLVDTGAFLEDTRAAYLRLREMLPFMKHPPRRVLITHDHPDHIGLAGEFAQAGSELWMSRTCWLQGRIQWIDSPDTLTEEEVEFAIQAGLSGMALEAYLRRSPRRYAKVVFPLPRRYRRMIDGETVTMGGRNWRVILGHGHASAQCTLWSDDLVLAGDQILPGISANLSVTPADLEADLVHEWLESCRRMERLDRDGRWCLPGHQSPFLGIRTRCQQMMMSVHATLRRLWEALEQPKTAFDVLASIYGREIQADECSLLMAEAWSYLNHLHAKALVRKRPRTGAGTLWYRVADAARGTKGNLPEEASLHRSEDPFWSPSLLGDRS